MRIRNTINSLPPFLTSMSKSKMVWSSAQRYSCSNRWESFSLVLYLWLCPTSPQQLSIFFCASRMINSLLIKNLFYRYFNTFFLVNIRLVALGTVLFLSGELGFACSDPSCVDLTFNFDVMLSSLCPSSWDPAQCSLQFWTILTLAYSIVSSRLWNDICFQILKKN